MSAVNVVAQNQHEFAAPVENLLDIRELCVFFRDESGWLQPLKDVSLTVKAGEIVGLVGESGCGKSLTALSILNLLPSRGCRRTGQILFGGKDLVPVSEAEMRRVRGRHIAMIFQEPMSALDPVFTVGSQISETVRTHGVRDPGVGSLVSYSAVNKDFPVVQGVVLVLVTMVILINLIVDILSAILDPRVAEA
jgi:ABC-type glutathione transport system ATPase component